MGFARVGGPAPVALCAKRMRGGASPVGGYSLHLLQYRLCLAQASGCHLLPDPISLPWVTREGRSPGLLLGPDFRYRRRPCSDGAWVSRDSYPGHLSRRSPPSFSRAVVSGRFFRSGLGRGYHSVAHLVKNCRAYNQSTSPISADGRFWFLGEGSTRRVAVSSSNVWEHAVLDLAPGEAGRFEDTGGLRSFHRADGSRPVQGSFPRIRKYPRVSVLLPRALLGT